MCITDEILGELIRKCMYHGINKDSINALLGDKDKLRGAAERLKHMIGELKESPSLIIRLSLQVYLGTISLEQVPWQRLRDHIRRAGLDVVKTCLAWALCCNGVSNEEACRALEAACITGRLSVSLGTLGDEILIESYYYFHKDLDEFISSLYRDS